MPLIRINRNPGARQLAVFALAWLAFGGVMGWVLWSRGRHPAAEFAWVLAAGVPLAGAGSPKVLRWAYLGLSYATYPVGFVVSYVALAVLFFGVITPAGIVMRLLRYDPLARRFDPGARSYWLSRPGKKPAESYFNQS